MPILLALLLALLLAACRAEETTTAVASLNSATTAVLQATLQPTTTPPPTAAATESVPTTLVPVSPTSPPTTAPLPSPTPFPLAAYTIDGMRARAFSGGAIRIGDLLEQNESFSRYAISYPSDDLTIGGVMNIPVGDGPFPVVLLLHGYVERDQYWPGADTWQAAEFFARNGYLTIAPDFRSWGISDSGPSFFHMGLVADTLNLIGALPSLPQADPQRLALWGHSMGGGIATKVLVIDDRVRAAVLYAPNSADDADLIDRWGPGCLPGQSEAAGDHCNPAEVIPADLPDKLLAAYLAGAVDPAILRQVAPIHHLAAVNAPLQIHIGTADGASLTETPPDWSRKLQDALQAAGKETAYFTYPDQGHFFQGEAWSTLMNRSLTFFEEVLQS